MFQLIVAVVAIALIALMVIAALYFGGSAHTEAAVRAQYAGNMNAAAQIEGAMQLYYNEHGTNPPGENEELLQTLKDNHYLKDIPEGTWTVSSTQIFKPFSEQSQDIKYCATMNKVAGFNVSDPVVGLESDWAGCPPCNGGSDNSNLGLAEQYKSWPGCQMAATVPSGDDD